MKNSHLLRYLAWEMFLTNPRVKTLVPVQSSFSNQRVASWKSQLKLISHRKYLFTINKQDYKLDRITSESFSVRYWRRTNMTYPVNLALSQEASVSTSKVNIALFSLKTALIRCTLFKYIVSDWKCYQRTPGPFFGLPLGRNVVLWNIIWLFHNWTETGKYFHCLVFLRTRLNGFF